MLLVEGTNRWARATVQNLSTVGGVPSTNPLGVHFRLVEGGAVVDIGPTIYSFGGNEIKTIELLFPALRGSGGFAPGGVAGSIGIYVYEREQVLSSAAALFGIVLSTPFTATALTELQASTTLSQLQTAYDAAVAAYEGGVITYEEYLALYDCYVLRYDFLISPTPSDFAKQLLSDIATALSLTTLGTSYGSAVQSRQKNEITYGEFLAIYYAYLTRYYGLAPV